MSKEDQLVRSMHLLSQALGAAGQSMPNDKNVIEAKTHMRQAMKKLEGANKTYARRLQKTITDANNWWGNVVAKTPVAKMSEQSAIRTLDYLNGLIAEEKQTIAQLETKVRQATQQKPKEDTGPSLLHD